MFTKTKLYKTLKNNNRAKDNIYSGYSESWLQAECYKQFVNEWPEYKTLFNSIPNEGIRSVINANRMKATGLTTGFPDTQINLFGKTCFIEFKIPSGKLSPGQILVRSKLMSHGFDYHICRDSISFWIAIIFSFEELSDAPIGPGYILNKYVNATHGYDFYRSLPFIGNNDYMIIASRYSSKYSFGDINLKEAKKQVNIILDLH